MSDYQDIDPAEAIAACTRARLVDVREPHEFVGDLGHIPGAELVPLAQLEAHVAIWDRNDEIIVICRSGRRSARAAEALVRAGFRRVKNLAGGMEAYRAAMLPVSHG